MSTNIINRIHNMLRLSSVDRGVAMFENCNPSSCISKTVNTLTAYPRHIFDIRLVPILAPLELIITTIITNANTCNILAHVITASKKCLVDRLTMIVRDRMVV